jgi:hypothetical protein
MEEITLEMKSLLLFSSAKASEVFSSQRCMVFEQLKDNSTLLRICLILDLDIKEHLRVLRVKIWK